MDYLERYFSSDEGQSADSLEQLKACLLGHCRAPIKAAVDDIQQLLIAAINLAYRKSPSREDLLSADKARAALADEVVNKSIAGKFIWAKLASHMGTHHPKSRNDKVRPGLLWPAL